MSALLIYAHSETPSNLKAKGIGLALVVLAGLCHGQAHGVEAPHQQLNQYIAGFVTTSIGLHLLGFTAMTPTTDISDGYQVLQFTSNQAFTDTKQRAVIFHYLLPLAAAPLKIKF